MKRVFAHIGFSMAIALLVLNLLSLDVALIISALLAILLIVSIAVPKIRQMVAVPLCLGAALFACLVFMCGNAVVAPQIKLDNKTAYSSFYYVDIPEINEESCTYIVKTVNVDSENSPQNIKLKIKTDMPIDAKPYQVVTAKLNFSRTGENAYKSSYYSKGIYLNARAEDIKLTNTFVASPWKWVYDLRLDIIKTLSDTLKGDVGSLASALVTGYKKGLSDKLYSSMKFAGVVHLIAVSGFHLTVITGGLFFVLKLLKANDRIIAVFGTVFVIVCIGLGGFSKSIIRASIMMLVLLWGNASENRADTLNSLGVAVAIMCLNPFAVTDVGMQLSTVSTLALIITSPRIAKMKFGRFQGLFIIPWIITLCNLPIMAISFGYVSLAGLVANVFVTIIGSASLVSSIVSYIAIKLGVFPTMFAFVSKWLITVLIKIVRFFATRWLAVVPLDNEIVFVIIGAILMVGVALMLKNKKLLKPLSTIAVLMVVLSVAISTAMNVDTARVLVTQNGAIAIAYKEYGYAYNVNDKSDYYTVKAFLFSNHIELDEIGECGNFIEVNGISILVDDNATQGADIIIKNNEIYEPRGIIDLENGDVMYKIKADSSYDVNWLRMN